jgi:hypothetical protein
VPFAEACIEANAAEEAKKYIAMCGEERVELYVRVKAYKEAAGVARETKNVEQLMRIRELVQHDRQTLAQIEHMLAELNK